MLQYGECSLYLESHLDNIQTYSNLGFEVIQSSAIWLFSIEQCIPVSDDICRMSIHHFVSSGPASTGTATIKSCIGARSCCKNKAFETIPAHELAQYDVALFEQFDAIQMSPENDCFVSRCNACDGISDTYSNVFFNDCHYQFAQAHWARCRVVDRDHKKFLGTLQSELLATEGQNSEESTEKISCRWQWLAAFNKAVLDSSCISGCGCPDRSQDTSPKGGGDAISICDSSSDFSSLNEESYCPMTTGQ